MLSPTDAAYIATKEIKLGRAELKSPFRECAEKLRGEFPGVSILNVAYEKVPPDGIPRLCVIVEFEREQREFLGAGFMYDKAKQDRARTAFEAALSATSADSFDTNRLFVFFSDFESVARYEAAGRVRKADRERLIRGLMLPTLWTIEGVLDRVDFMFYTDEQEKAACEELRTLLTREYSALVGKHDEFGYLAERPLHYYFSSKETFDRDYQSSWYHYFK